MNIESPTINFLSSIGIIISLVVTASMGIVAIYFLVSANCSGENTNTSVNSRCIKTTMCILIAVYLLSLFASIFLLK
ncbi:hypothetical protein DICPUDRAFT_151909 [Dictyostelium purpureum]|uniref:Uncharacterized protein n=1 Tax=Dictyostelium purpureum TaxID=5786 RepID=F0ZK24_DICPU|nr:uncharacterized protein DICPUDRAFT_151909 [Dictyostelium purpureum]EGC35715.1 hypothetical protein DICPUDRAFT_151909 [Dictyostelium purpureum]|eukprot:XP_003287771.1 hypothetical protein DICPUDRAFT_151909 [Dictyostelium purpureum]